MAEIAERAPAAQTGKVAGTGSFKNRQVHIDQLRRSADNVRQKAKSDEEQGRADSVLQDRLPRAVLRATLEAVGLINPLVVQATDEDGVFEVVAGGRRLEELRDMRRKGQLAEPMIDCREVPQGADRAMVSLAENVARLEMHPADECAAFLTLFKRGHSLERIAAAFATDTRHVGQRLALANLHPKIAAAFRARKLSMDAAQAFTCEADQATQLHVFEQLAPRGWFHAYHIRQALRGEDLPVTHRLVRLVGLEAYREAGGAVAEDLFTQREGEGVMLTDPMLLEGLAASILEDRAEALRAEGWGWVEVLLNEDVHRLAGQRRLEPVARRGLNRSQAGLFVVCSHDGQVREEGPYISQSAARAAQRAAQRAAAGEAGADEEVGAVAAERVPESLMLSLTAHRSAALQCALLGNPRVALALLAATMVSDAYEASCTGLHLQVTGQDFELKRHARGYAGTRAAEELAAADAAWAARIPDDQSALEWFLAQPQEVSLAAIAWATARAFSLVSPRPGATAESQALVAALGFDFADYFVANEDTCLGQLPKAAVIAAVREACGEAGVAGLEGLKKAELIKVATERLVGTRWVPAAVR